ncbi:MAG: hypothetical protein JWM31_1258 [Solirubrobacterales bacterium]|nr:hypothetical protein [Solirubrobacterales bacterium]
MSTEDRTLVTVALTGKSGPIAVGTFETITGRELTSTGDKYRPGPGQAERAFGGPSSYSDITVTRTFNDATDDALYRLLLQEGSRASGTCTEQPLDTNYASFGAAVNWPVRLQGVKRPDVDINSGNRRVLELTFWVDGDPS